MNSYRGKVLNGRGELIGWGLELDNDGAVLEVKPVDAAGEGEPEGWIIPGLIDIHCHGGGGASFPDATTEDEVHTAIAAHRNLGTTGMIASLVSMIDPLPQIKLLASFCERGELLGIHLEGPYVSLAHVGAQNPAAVRNPNLDELRTWLEAGKGWIKTMTIAPELPGAKEAAQLLLDYGALPSWGHTDATMMQTRESEKATWQYAQQIEYPRVPQTATHLFNGMPLMAHREPGPVRELVQAARRGEVVVELIADGVHVNLDLVGDVVNYVQDAGDGLGLALITDAMAAAGLSDGSYELGGLPVTVKGGVATLTQGSSIAGGTSRLVEQLQRTVFAGVLTLAQGVRAAVAAPAKLLGLSDETPGVSVEFTAGQLANFIALNESLDIQTVVREGAAVKA
ncbi:MAG: amidohydrolase family protein [Actinomycetaceae bacterium]|nr:amidohydrolase family protein [Actinomycetaceae bacterium]MDY5854234.1 amidohydrolase family protein [Arcanobacterium sp.]